MKTPARLTSGLMVTWLWCASMSRDVPVRFSIPWYGVLWYTRASHAGRLAATVGDHVEQPLHDYKHGNSVCS